MPTYEYACEACKHQFEEFQSITAKPITTCPKCKKKKVKRLISGGAGFLFKGSGFYITDYRSDNYKAAAKSESSGSSSGSSSNGSSGSATPAKSDAAPAAKPESKPASKSASKK